MAGGGQGDAIEPKGSREMQIILPEYLVDLFGPVRKEKVWIGEMGI